MTAVAIENTKKLTRKELEALKEEKHALANAAIKRLRNRYNALADIKKEADDEQSLIKARIAELLDEQDMKDFIDVDGTPIIGYRRTEKNELDKEKLVEKFGDKAVQDCYTLRIGRSFFSKR
jgi:hypothetical protein